MISTITMQEEITVGKRGEILPKKSLREISGIHPGDKVLVEARANRIIINKIPSIEDVFDMPIIARATPEQVEAEMDAEGRKHEEGIE